MLSLCPFCAVVAAALMAATGCAQPGGLPSGGVTVERVVVAMGTSLQLQVTASLRSEALRASEAGVRAIEDVQARLSTWTDDSELSRLNRAPVGRSINLSGALLAELSKARRWSRATGGAFDPGVGALVDLYGLREGGRWPTDQEVWSCLAHTGIEQLHVVYKTVSRRSARFRIEEGGFGKGAGLDAAAQAVLQAGAMGACFDFGGQVLCVGSLVPADGWLIADPRNRLQPALQVRVDGGSLATTANSERRIRVGERNLGHILDPRTGRPAPDFGSVTVWAEDAFTADCLSTAMFVMGPDQALVWAEQQEGVEAVILDERASTGSSPNLVARATSGLRHRVTALLPDITFR